MKKSFACSLICHNGIIGGGICIEDNKITYKTNKLTAPQKYKNFVMLRSEINTLTWKWIVFPIASFTMKNGEINKFIIFNKKRFEKWYSSDLK